MIDLSSWPEGSRLILRKERPHPGAQLTSPTWAAPDHRVPHRHPPRRDPGRRPGWSCGTVSTPGSKTGSARARPAGCGPSLPGLGGKPGLAGGRARPPSIWSAGPSRSASPTPRTRPLRDRHLPLPGPARRRPDHPLRPPHLPPHRPHLAVGHPHRRRLPPPPRRIHLTSPARHASPSHPLAPARSPSAQTPYPGRHGGPPRPRQHGPWPRRRPPGREQDQIRRRAGHSRSRVKEAG